MGLLRLLFRMLLAEEAPGKTPEILARQWLSVGLGTCWDCLGRAGQISWGERSLDFSAWVADRSTQPQREDGWIRLDHFSLEFCLCTAEECDDYTVARLKKKQHTIQQRHHLLHPRLFCHSVSPKYPLPISSPPLSKTISDG